jgi:glutaredoxin
MLEFQQNYNQPLRSVPQVKIDGELVGGFEKKKKKIKGPKSINKV